MTFSLENAPARLGEAAAFGRREIGALLLCLAASACGSAERPSASAEPASRSDVNAEMPKPAASSQSPAPGPQSAPPRTSESTAAPTSVEQVPTEMNTPAQVAASSCTASADSANFVDDCVACAGTDDCASCLCTDCTDAVQSCIATAGCTDILACVRGSGCSGVDCYCGDASAVRCAGGDANGTCKDTFLSAPGGHPPTLKDPSAGPASDAAQAVEKCLQRDKSCLDICNGK
jgi:hypothetical protein